MVPVELAIVLEILLVVEHVAVARGLFIARIYQLAGLKRAYFLFGKPARIAAAKIMPGVAVADGFDVAVDGLYVGCGVATAVLEVGAVTALDADGVAEG